ncbi:MAG: TRAP transporter small permease subunit [Pseudomonadota bacterium]
MFRQGLVSILRSTERFGRWLGEVTSWFALGTLFSVLVAVTGGAMGANIMLDWGFHVPLLGNDLTINDVFDLEWHFFAVMVMAGGTYAYLDNRHVRSDLIYSGLSSRAKKWIDTIGDVCFLLPFAAVMVWLSTSFVARSFNAAEKSDYGGMIDRFAIKSVIPIGFSILFLVVLARVIRRFLDEKALAEETSES